MASIDIIRQLSAKEALLRAFNNQNIFVIRKIYMDDNADQIMTATYTKTELGAESFEADTMEYLGSGYGGSVYRLKDNEGKPIDKVLKVVRTFPNTEKGRPFKYSELLVNTPVADRKKFYPGSLKSMTMNRIQANFFKELLRIKDKDEIPNGLPIIYKYAEGKLPSSLRNEMITAKKESEKKFPEDAYVSLWIMEYIPCVYKNEFCGKIPMRRKWTVSNLKNKSYTKENEAYGEVATFVLNDMGYVMKDVVNPRNFGIRNNGEIVYFDPFLIPYPSQELNTNEKLMASLLYGFDGEEKFQKAIDNGNYFKYRSF